jgi:hypothetical protein
MKKATDSYFTARSTGVRGTKNLFTLNTNIDAKAIQKNLVELIPNKDYLILPVRQKEEIKVYVEKFTNEPYRVGSAYYELNDARKTEKI